MTQTKLALEGIVHAGKTTLLHAIGKQRNDVCCIEEYTAYRGEREFPPFPNTSEEACSANKFFIDLDSRRFADATDSRIVLLDRSCISVLAYHYATEQVTLGKVQCFTQSLQLFQTTFAGFVPDKIIYVEISMSDLVIRHVGDNGVYKEILLSPEFNEHLCNFYDRLDRYFPRLTVYKVDGRLPILEGLAHVNKIIDSL